MRLTLVLTFFFSTVTASVFADENTMAGEVIFNHCMACHGEQGMGDEDNEAPRLAGQHSWYLVTQLENFRASRRGTHEDDENGQMMQAMAANLSDEDIENVAAYIAMLPVD